MNLEQVIGKLSASEQGLGAANAQIATLTAAATAQTTQLSAVTAERDAARTELAASPKKADLDAAVAALSDIFARQSVALGVKDAKAPAETGALIAAIGENNTKLGAFLPEGGRARAADASTPSPAVNLDAYRTRKD